MESDEAYNGYTPSGSPSVEEILEKNDRRNRIIHAPYDPVKGDPSDPGRLMFDLPGLDCGKVWIPVEMMADPLPASLLKAGSVDMYIHSHLNATPSDVLRREVNRRFIRLRIAHDFPFWAASFVYIKAKGGGDDKLFVINRPQRKLVAALEEMRRAGKPLRLVLLKARQWGGRTPYYLLIYLK